jgi:anti-sigma regulatory factor (Ser/Thr protein kinase)
VTELKVAPEEPIARVTVLADAGFLPPVIEFVKQMTFQLGLGDDEPVDRAVELVCLNVIEHAFGPEEEASFDVEVLRRPGLVVVVVEDQGLPFDYKRLQDGEDRTVLEILHRSFDETRFVNLGRRGNRVELLKHLPLTDVRDYLPEEEHHRTVEATAAHEDVPLEIRMMYPE